MADDKRDSSDELRAEFRARRDSLEVGERRTRSRLVMAKFEALPEIEKAQLLGCYLPFGSEVDTTDMVRGWLARDRRIAAVVFVDEGPRLTEVDHLGALSADEHGTLRPVGRPKPLEIEQLDALVVPGLAYSPSRRRLGDAMDRYDELLGLVHCPVIATAYDLQLTERIDVLPDLRQVDVVVAETVTYRAP